MKGCLIIFLIMVSGHALAEGRANSLNIGGVAPESIAIDKAIQHIERSHCRTPDCLSLVRLNHVFDIIDTGEETTMGAARYLEPDEPFVEERRLHHALLDHPKFFGSMCKLLIGLASRYGRPGARQGVDEELFVGVQTINIALRMDSYGPPNCLPKVLAAMPHTAEADATIANMKNACENEPVARNPCARIMR